MSWLAHWRARAAFERAFVAGVSRRRWRSARQHAARCPRCRAHYDRLAAVSRAFGDPLPAGALDRLGESLGPPPRSQHRRWWVAATIAAALTAAVIAVMSLPRTSDRPALRPRGREAAQLVPGDRDPGVRLFCVRPDDSGGEVIHEARATVPDIEAPTLRCILGGELQLAYSTPSLDGMTMIAYSRDAAGRAHFYAPRGPGEPAAPLAAGVIDEPLGWSTRLAASHSPGEYEVVIRFFSEPLVARFAASELARPLYELHAQLSIASGSPP